MCFYIHPEHQKKLIATEAITCYKRLVVNHLRKKVSPYLLMQYKTRQIYSDKIGRICGIYRPTIKKGLHSYSTLRGVIGGVEHLGGIIMECKIPKGAEYYYNPSKKEYVSNQLRTVKLIKI